MSEENGQPDMVITSLDEICTAMMGQDSDRILEWFQRIIAEKAPRNSVCESTRTTVVADMARDVLANSDPDTAPNRVKIDQSGKVVMVLPVRGEWSHEEREDGGGWEKGYLSRGGKTVVLAVVGGDVGGVVTHVCPRSGAVRLSVPSDATGHGHIPTGVSADLLGVTGTWVTGMVYRDTEGGGLSLDVGSLSYQDSEDMGVRVGAPVSLGSGTVERINEDSIDNRAVLLAQRSLPAVVSLVAMLLVTSCLQRRDAVDDTTVETDGEKLLHSSVNVLFMAGPSIGAMRTALRREREGDMERAGYRDIEYTLSDINDTWVQIGTGSGAMGGGALLAVGPHSSHELNRALAQRVGAGDGVASSECVTTVWREDLGKGEREGECMCPTGVRVEVPVHITNSVTESGLVDVGDILAGVTLAVDALQMVAQFE
ncbi:hypothetical protein KIPB_002270 [Kipferlia bialata]|uniref:Uncharacterized protein n=1 Tax=Kipferlia bialata TaxID=797122 RepID=A0A9K3GG00_9EUKA|nr:hypothetical protein KIPB_002270 [Kipferlia bialata]|eukprot:g2270.t1